MRTWYERFGSFARVIHFDKRGTGMSDAVSPATTLETRMDDVRAVMDAAGSERTALIGLSEGGPMSASLRRRTLTGPGRSSFGARWRSRRGRAITRGA